MDRIELEQGDPALVLYNAAAVRVIDIFEEDWRTIQQRMDVNVSGGFALQPFPQGSSLSIGKAGLRNLVQTLAARVAGAAVHGATLTVCGFVKGDDPRYNPDAITEQFWRLYGQPPGQFSWESHIESKRLNNEKELIMNIAFIGFGQGGGPLADHLQRLGHAVTLAAKNPESDSVK